MPNALLDPPPESDVPSYDGAMDADDEEEVVVDVAAVLSRIWGTHTSWYGVSVIEKYPCLWMNVMEEAVVRWFKLAFCVCVWECVSVEGCLGVPGFPLPFPLNID